MCVHSQEMEMIHRDPEGVHFHVSPHPFVYPTLSAKVNILADSPHQQNRPRAVTLYVNFQTQTALADLLCGCAAVGADEQ